MELIQLRGSLKNKMTFNKNDILNDYLKVK